MKPKWWKPVQGRRAKFHWIDPTGVALCDKWMWRATGGTDLPEEQATDMKLLCVTCLKVKKDRELHLQACKGHAMKKSTRVCVMQCARGIDGYEECDKHQLGYCHRAHKYSTQWRS